MPPTRGGTYKELPQFLALKKCVVNVKNTDNRCCGYSIAASRVLFKGSRKRPTLYDRYFRDLLLDRIQYPVEPNQVPELEILLKTNISIFSFFDDEGKGRYPHTYRTSIMGAAPSSCTGKVTWPS